MVLDDKLTAFVEAMGLVMERSSGASPMFGRLFGLLLVADEPLSLDEMADLLQVTKPAISTTMPLFEMAGLAQRVRTKRGRKHYYEMVPDAFEQSLIARMSRLGEMIGVLESGLRALGQGNGVSRKRLEEARDMYAFMAEQMEGAVERWQTMRAARASEEIRKEE